MNRINRYCAVLLIVVLFSSGTAFAKEADALGIGIILGEPTGISLKSWLDDKRAIDTAVAWTFEKDSSFTLYANYLVHRYDLINGQMSTKGGNAPLYYGLGAKIAVGEEVKLGMRIPLGITYIFKKDPLDFFIEIAPGINLVPSSDLSISGGVGIRYYIR